VMVARPISLHEQNLAIFGQNSKHTLMSCGHCLALRASRTDCWRANSGGNYVRWQCSVPGASRTVEELIQDEILYVD
jgi:hypothetical protein